MTEPELQVLNGARARLAGAIAELSRLAPSGQTTERRPIDAAALEPVLRALTAGAAHGAEHSHVQALSGSVEGIQRALEEAKGASSHLGDYYVTALLDRASEARAELDQLAGAPTPALPAADEVSSTEDSSDGVPDDAGDTPRALPPASGSEPGPTSTAAAGDMQVGLVQTLRGVRRRIAERTRDLMDRALFAGSTPGKSIMRREALGPAESKKALPAGDGTGSPTLSDTPGLPGVIETIARAHAELEEMASNSKNWRAEVEDEQRYDISDDDRTHKVNTGDEIKRLAELEEAVATAIEGAGQMHASELKAIADAFLELEAGLADANYSQKPAALRKALDVVNGALEKLLTALGTLGGRYSKLLDNLAESPIDPTNLPRGARTRDHFPKPPTSS